MVVVEQIFYNDGTGKVMYTTGEVIGYNTDEELVIKNITSDKIIKIPKFRIVRREVLK